MGTTPLRLDSANDGNLKQITTTEENYLAYQAGLHLSRLDSSDVAALTASSTDATSIGSYTDTKFDDAVGTHGFSGGTIPISQTITTLYQKDGIVDFANDSADFRRPIEFVSNSGDAEIHEFDSSETDTISDRLLSRIFVSEYPGCYKLGSSSPGAGWSVYKSGVFEDTLQTGVSGTAYNLYVKSSMAAPATSRTVGIKRSSGATGTYQGLQEMNDPQIAYTFGSRIQSRIGASATSIGNYQLRSSAQGVPTDAGTWVSKGTATDTRRDIVDTNYTNTFSRTRTSNYTVGNFSRNFEGNYTRIFTGDFTGNYTRITATNNFESGFSVSFEGNYSRTTSTRNRATAFEGEATYTGNFEGNYSRTTSTVNSTTGFVGEATYTGNFEGNYSRVTSTRNRATNYVGPATYTGDFTGNFTTPYSRTRATNYTRTNVNYQGDYTGNFTTAYSRNFVGDFVGENTVVYTRSSSYTVTYAGNFLGDYVNVYNYQRTSTRNRVSANFLRTLGYLGSRNSTNAFANSYSRVTSTRNSVGDYVGSGTFTGNFVGNYSRTTSTVNSTAGFVGTATYVGDFGGNFTTAYSRTRITDYVGPATYTGDFTGNFTTAYSRIRATDYVGPATYTGDFTGNFTTAYTRNSVVTRTSNFEGNFTTAYTRNSTAGRSSSYTRTRSSSYAGQEFSRNFQADFVGDFVGSTIGSGTSTIETYTLYVRTAT
jgi:hypothetical protein